MLKPFKQKMYDYEIGFFGALATSLLFFVLRFIIAPLIRLLFVGRIEGLHHLPAKGPYIVASNHESYLDFMCFWAVSPHTVQYLAAEKFYDSKFWKPIMVATGQIKVERQSKNKTGVHDRAHYILKNEGVLGIFPEGTRSRSGEMGRAYTGVTRFALEAKVPIVPVGMIGTGEAWPPHKKLPRLKKSHIKIEPPVHHHEHYEKEHTEQLLRHLTDELMWQIGKMTGKEYGHHYDYGRKRVIEGRVVNKKS